MERVYWYARNYGSSTAIIASFDRTARRVCITHEQLRQSPDASSLVRHAVEQLTLSIRATRRALAQQLAFSELH